MPNIVAVILIIVIFLSGLTVGAAIEKNRLNTPEEASCATALKTMQDSPQIQALITAGARE